MTFSLSDRQARVWTLAREGFGIVGGSIVVALAAGTTFVAGDASAPSATLAIFCALGIAFSAYGWRRASARAAKAELEAREMIEAAERERQRFARERIEASAAPVSGDLDQPAPTLEPFRSRVAPFTPRAWPASEPARGAVAVATPPGEAADTISGRILVARGTAIEARVGEIADDVGQIQAIALRTNVAALNAAIEAARLGATGRGIALVAREVKALADQNAHATERLIEQIAALGAAAADASAKIVDIGAALRRANGRAAEATPRATSPAATDTEITAAKLKELTSALARTGGATDDILGLAADTSARARALREAMDEFLAKTQSE